MQNEETVLELLAGDKRPDSQYAQNASNLLKLLLATKQPTSSVAKEAVRGISFTYTGRHDSADDACSVAVLFHALLIAWPSRDFFTEIDCAVGEVAESDSNGHSLLRGYLLGMLEVAISSPIEKPLKELIAKNIGETLIALLGRLKRDRSLGKGERYLGQLANVVSEFVKRVDASIVFRRFKELYEPVSKRNSRLSSSVAGNCDYNMDALILDEFIFKEFRQHERMGQIRLLAG